MHENLMAILYDRKSIVRTIENAEKMAPDQASAIQKLPTQSRNVDVNDPEDYVDKHLDIQARIRELDHDDPNAQPREYMHRLLEGMHGI